jgi:polysaccharide pyruvyl transferase WcaK-like protein
MNRKKIGFYGHFGTRNTGNESTLLTVLAQLRSRLPDTDFYCVCTNPEAVVAEVGIAALPITSRSARLWDRNLPAAKRVTSGFAGAVEEVRQWWDAVKTLEGTEMLIVPGTGLLTDAWGVSSWGPYNLFKWSLAARLRGAKLIFLNVGAGPIYTRLGRMLIGSSLRLAHYRSYRDRASLGVVRGIGIQSARDRVYPDLVFDLPHDLYVQGSNGARKRRIAGLGLMVYAGRYSVADPSETTYERYLESLVILTDWLLAHDYDVRLLLGDGEPQAVEDFREAFRDQSKEPALEDRISSSPAQSVKEIVSQITDTDVVVATRFHNVLFSLVLERPVISISFHHKCASLMSEMGLADYCFDIHELDAVSLVERFEDLESKQDEVKRVIREGVARNRRALDEQYRQLLANAGSQPSFVD